MGPYKIRKQGRDKNLLLEALTIIDLELIMIAGMNYFAVLSKLPNQNQIWDKIQVCNYGESPGLASTTLPDKGIWLSTLLLVIDLLTLV